MKICWRGIQTHGFLKKSDRFLMKSGPTVNDPNDICDERIVDRQGGSSVSVCQRLLLATDENEKPTVARNEQRTIRFEFRCAKKKFIRLFVILVVKRYMSQQKIRHGILRILVDSIKRYLMNGLVVSLFYKRQPVSQHLVHDRLLQQEQGVINRSSGE